MKHHYRLRKLLFKTLGLTMLLMGFDSKAQVNLSKIVSTAPPNVASFEKYGNVPVTYNTGQVGYSLPLYSLKVDDNLSIPIALQYSNTGLKPDEVPSWVGHGWDLMVGGYITQSVQGVDDFSERGLRQPWIKSLKDDFLSGTLSGSAATNWVNKVSDGWYDAQPDVFSMNILGKSTKFFFNGTIPVFLQYAPYQLTVTASGFSVVDEKGYTYEFSTSVISSGSYADNLATAPDPYELSARTWYLTKIITPSLDEVILTYGNDIEYSVYLTSFSREFGPDPWIQDVSGYGTQLQCDRVINGVSSANSSNSTVGQYILRRIAFKGRNIDFTTISRNDLFNVQGQKANALAKILITNERNKVISDIRFSYDNQSRLMLDKISINNPVTTRSEKSYVFTYLSKNDCASTPLINRAQRSYAVDHWGFANGAVGNTADGIPRMDYRPVIPFINFSLFPVVYGTSFRGASGRASQAGMLKRITYPSGGYTEFEYEPNDLRFIDSEQIPFFLRPDTTNNGPCALLATNSVRCPDRFSPGAITGSFQVPVAYNNAVLRYQLFSSNPSEYSSLRISGPGGQVFYKHSFDETSATRLVLPAGTYSYVLQAGCITPLPDIEDNSRSYAEFDLRGCEDSIRVEIGGNRVARIRDVDSSRTMATIRRLIYTKPHLWQEPFYVSLPFARSIGYTLACVSCGESVYLSGKSRGGWDGYHLTYERITELLGENGEGGKNVYHYGGGVVFVPGYARDPYPTAQNMSWRNGALVKQEQFRKTNTSYSLRKKLLYEYTATPSNIPLTQMGVSFRNKVIGCSTPSFPDYSAFFTRGIVSLGSDRFDLAKLTEVEYGDNNTVFQTESIREYTTDYFQLRSTTTRNSYGNNVQKTNWYAQDYAANISNTGVADLQRKHIVSLPLKQTKTVQGKLVEGEVYQRNSAGSIIEQAKFMADVPQAGSAHDPTVLFPSGYIKQITLKYSAFDKLQEQNKVRDAPTAYLWGYNNTYPIAVVRNASHAEVVAALGQNIVDGLANATPVNDVQVRQLLAPIRTRLPRAQVSTYTYDPLVGMTSQTDPSGRTIFYEYDALGRLKQVKDEQGRVLQAQDYHYARP